MYYLLVAFWASLGCTTTVIGVAVSGVSARMTLSCSPESLLATNILRGMNACAIVIGAIFASVALIRGTCCLCGNLSGLFSLCQRGSALARFSLIFLAISIILIVSLGVSLENLISPEVFCISIFGTVLLCCWNRGFIYLIKWTTCRDPDDPPFYVLPRNIFRYHAGRRKHLPLHANNAAERGIVRSNTPVRVPEEAGISNENKGKQNCILKQKQIVLVNN